MSAGNNPSPAKAADAKWRPRGFTLIELMAVVTIIALLVGGTIYFTMNYSGSTQTVVSNGTLETLNKALDNYRIEDGMNLSHSLGGPNTPAKIQAVITALKNGITLSNGTYAHFVESSVATTYSGLTAIGSGANMTFVYANNIIPVTAPIPQPQISCSGSMNFGTITVNTTSTATLTIQNTGSASLTVSSISYPSGYSGNWSGGTITPGSSQNVTVTFAPTLAQVYYGTITATSNDPINAAAGVAVSGTGGQPGISLAGNMAFGAVNSGSTAAQSLTINNPGTLPLMVSTISLPSGYTSNWTSGTIAAGGFQNVNITFSPAAVTAYNGTITVNSNAGSVGNTIPVTGSGTQGVLSLGGTLAFGNVCVGTISTATLTISNTGTYPITVSNVALSPSTGYSVDWTSGVIAAGGVRNVTVTFAPTTTTTYSSTLTVTSNAASGANTAAVSGTGVQGGISVTPNPLAFGPVAINTTSTATMNINNTGCAPISVSAISYPTGYSGAWSGTIPSSSSQPVTVTFNPTVVQAYNGTITVTSNASSGTNTTLVTGAGVLPPEISLSVTSGSLAFGLVTANTTATATLRITNPGNAPLYVSSITYPGNYTGAFTGTIAAGGHQDVVVSFTPTVVGTAYNGTITVNTNAAAGTNTVAVTGTGGSAIIALSGSMNFGAVVDYYTATATLTISNTGNTPLIVTSITAPAGIYFSGVTYPFTIAATSGTQNVTVTYAPTTVGGYVGTITVASDKTSGTNTVPVTGSSGIMSKIWVADSTNNRVESFSVAGLYQSQFGTSGSTNGKFSGTKGIAFDSNANLWVVDYGNNRVQEINSAGTYISQFGTSGSGNGQLNGPFGIAIDGSGNFWVVDSGNSRVEEFNSSSTYVSQFGTSGSGNGQFNIPEGIAIDASGNIWVADSMNNRVQEFNSSGTYVSQFGTSGSGNGQLSHPFAIAIDAAGNLWVADYSNARIEEFNSSGTYISKCGTFGSGNGQLHFPQGIAIDVNGNLWVTDTANARVEEFNSSGTYVSTFGSSGSGNGQFTGPYGIAINKYPAISLTSTVGNPMAFGNVTHNTTATATLTINNTGNLPMVVSSISYPSGYTGTGTFPMTIAAGGSQPITVTFAPLAVQSYNGTITVTNNSGAGTNTIAVTGAGI